MKQGFRLKNFFFIFQQTFATESRRKICWFRLLKGTDAKKSITRVLRHYSFIVGKRKWYFMQKNSEFSSENWRFILHFIGMESSIVGCIENCNHSKRECIEIRKFGHTKGTHCRHWLSMVSSAWPNFSFFVLFLFWFVYFVVCFIFQFFFQSTKG